MTTYTVTNHTTYVDGYDLTGDVNATSLKISRQPIDVTTFSASARSRIAGLEDVASSVDGFWQAGSAAVDPQAFGNLGALSAVTQTPSGVEGERAYFYQCRSVQYQMFGTIGEAPPFSLTLQGARGSGSHAVGAVAGYLAKAKGEVTTAGVLGSAKQLGTVGAGQFLYAVLHVFGVGTTISVDLESADNADFTAATTRASFTGVTTTGGNWASRVAGSISDEFYRFRVTAITGTFAVAAAFGIK